MYSDAEKKEQQSFTSSAKAKAKKDDSHINRNYKVNSNC